MNRLRQNRQRLLYFFLAIGCAMGAALAQDRAPGGDGSLKMIDRKTAANLLLLQPPPEYPPVAKVNYIQGNVELLVTVNGAGIVAGAHVMDGDALLAASALQAVRRWTYRPLATAAGPAGFITTVLMKFSLHCKGLDLSPQRAEEDFLRRIKPAEILHSMEGSSSREFVHLRVLVDERGQVIDPGAAALGKERLEAVSESLRGLAFRPASWGNLPVASYVDVNVPLGALPITQAAANLGSR